MTFILSTIQRDLQYAVKAMQEKAWRDAIHPTEYTNDILFPGWRDDLRREVEKYRSEGVFSNCNISQNST